MKRFNSLLATALLAAILLVACSKDDPKPKPDPDPDPDPDIEFIANYMELVFTPVGDTSSTPFKPFFSALLRNDSWDIEAESLIRNTVYDVAITLIDSTVSPAKDIAQLIRNNPNDYQIFIEPNQSLLKFEATDTDGNALPVGLTWKATVENTTSNTSNVEITIIFAPGKKDGTINAGKKVFFLELPMRVRS